MSNYYAAGYQDALTKLAATRWEQVFRESPEILEEARGATGIALPLALRDKDKTAADYSEEPDHSDARISRIRSALGGALTGAGLGVVPAYMGAFHPKAIASIAGLGALAGGVGGALFPHRSTESRWGDIVIGEGIPTATSLAGGVGGAALGHKLFKGHMLGRALFGFPGAVLGGFGGSALARKLLESKVPESAPQMKEASAMSTDLMRVLLDDLLKQAELKEEKTKSLHAPKYDRRMKFSTALERSGHQASSEAPANEKTATDPAFDFAGVTGREGTVSVEDELERTPPLPIEEPMSYDVANKPVMQKESAEDELQTEQAPNDESDMYSFTQRHPMLLPLLLGLGGAAVGAIPGALLGGRLSARSAAKAFKAKVHPYADIPAKELARQRLYGRLTGGAVGGLLAGSGGLLGGAAINRRQPWEE